MENMFSMLERKRPTFYTATQYKQKAHNTKRSSKQYKKWREGVLKRCGYKCTECGATENLHVHHTKQYCDNIFLRTDPNNGTVLCRDCHAKQHYWMASPKHPIE